ncbi:hypothetical protein MNBD_ALPHA06-2175 [hydrothermal vent metagenome]|uniref:TonB C-terminal domain-containing protein n=1 Tax=hydrothermal vent metagenome TaxID=652676 RepID=A0A3B0RFQ5_9ZZZZ
MNRYVNVGHPAAQIPMSYTADIGFGPPLRFASSLPLAAAITLGLFLLMRMLTAVDLVPEFEKEQQWIPQIKPEIIELDRRTRTELFEPTQEVTPPPPVPVIEQKTATLPGEPISQSIGAIPDISKGDLRKFNTGYVNADRNVQPIIRVPPVYPSRMAALGKEGQCQAFFDISAMGNPMNITATCSVRGFEKPTIRAIGKWRYNPKISDGLAVIRRGVVTTLTYRLAD